MLPKKKNGISENEIVMYLAIGLKNLRLMALVVCMSLLVGLTYYNFSRPLYYAKSLVRYQTVEHSIDTQKIYNDANDRVVFAELASPHIMLRTAKKLGIHCSNVSDLQRYYVKKISTRFDADRNIVVEVWPFSYDLADKWTPAMVSEYLAWREEKRQGYTDSVIRAYAQDIPEVKKRIDDVFDTKYNYRDSNEVTKIYIEYNQIKDVPRDLFAANQQLMIMDRARHALDANHDTIAKLSILSSLDKEMQLKLGQLVSTAAAEAAAAAQNSGSQKDKENKDKDSTVIVMPEMASGGSSRWEELDKERRQLTQQTRELGQTYLPGHPKVAKLYKQMAALTQALELELEVATNRFNLQYANLLDKQSNLQSKVRDYDGVLRRYEKSKQDFSRLDAHNLPWSSYYADMEKRLSTFDFGADKERAEIQYSGHIEIKDRPVAPNRSKILTTFLMLGVALAVGSVFLLDYFDSRITDVEEAEEMLHIRGLCVIPKIEDAVLDKLVMVPDGSTKLDYHVQENFRMLRTNLVLTSDTPNGSQVTLVTSSLPQEGKTVVSSNLAISFAVKGEKTLLIDADLRRGRLHRVFGCSVKPGLSDVLRGNASLEEALRPTPNENLTVLTCGKHLNSAAELLDNPSFGKIMETLRLKYDRIIIDTPPALGLAETSIVQRHCDNIVFVIWSEFTPIRNVKAAIQSLQANGGKFAGFVLNRVDFDALGNRYKYFYYAPNYYANYKALDLPST